MPIAALRDARVLFALLMMMTTAVGARAEELPRPAQQAPTTVAPPGERENVGARSATPPASQSTAEQHKLPPDSTTKQTLNVAGRTLSFTATAGSIRLFDDKGEAQADIAYTAYELDDTDRAKRPVTFLFNGGPGAASAYLQLGNNGPWRLPINADQVTPSTSPDLQPNAETWLDFTDLVYIDPVGTGYSRFVATGDDVRKRFFSIDGDVSSIAVTIRRWLEKHDRLLSPKYVAGESYGGIRGPKVVRNLQVDQGIGVKGLILISPVMDFREFWGSTILQYVGSLPSYAAVARQMKGPVTRADLADVEAYARGDFLADLVKGEADTQATNRIADKVAALTGIDQAVSRRLAGRFDAIEFRREFDRKNGRITGRYDASVMGFDPYPEFELLSFRRSLRRGDRRAAFERSRRPHHAQAQLAAGRLVSTLQRRSRESLGFWPGNQSARVDFTIAAEPRARSEAESAGGARTVRSGDAVFRLENPARSVSRLCVAGSRQARGLSGRPHVLFARRLAPGLPRRRAGDDEGKIARHGSSLRLWSCGVCQAHICAPSRRRGPWPALRARRQTRCR